MKRILLALMLMAGTALGLPVIDILPGHTWQDYKLYVHTLPGGSNEWGNFVFVHPENTNKIIWRCHAQKLPPTVEQMATFTTGVTWNAAHKQTAAAVWNALDPNTKGILAAIEYTSQAGTNATRNQILRRYWQTYTNSLHGQVDE